VRILGDLVFAGLGQLKNMRVDNVAADPATPAVGQVWYNTVDGKYRGFDGVDVITFASGGSTSVLQAEIDQIEAEVGLDVDGNYVAPSGSNYLGSTTTVMTALTALDGQAKTNADAIGVNTTGITNNLTEINAIETGAGLNSDGTFTAAVGTNYIGGATALKGADVLLDTQIKANADAIAQNVLDIADRVLKAGDTMSGNLAFGGTHTVSGLAAPVNGTDAATKNYVDNLSVGLTWKNAVDSSGATNPATAVTGDRFLNTTDGKIYTATATDTWDAGVAAIDGDAVFDKVDETGYVYSGATWVQFTGLGQITAGVGLYKSGNQLHVGLGAGVAQLPTDEVGLDLHATSALFLTVDGSAASSDTAAQLSLLIDGSTLSKSATGVKVAATGITAAELATGVAGAGLTGGAGTALTIGAGTGIVVNADDVALDLTYLR